MPPVADVLPPESLLRELVKALVDAPGDVRIERVGTENASDSLMFIHVAPDDRGKVIGKQGATITALRTLFQRVVASQRTGGHLSIEVADSKTRRETA